MFSNTMSATPACWAFLLDGLIQEVLPMRCLWGVNLQILVTQVANKQISTLYFYPTSFGKSIDVMMHE